MTEEQNNAQEKTTETLSDQPEQDAENNQEQQPETSEQLSPEQIQARVPRYGLLNLAEPKGFITLMCAVIFDMTGAVLTILDLTFGIGEVISWVADDLCGGIMMYILLKDVGSAGAGQAQQVSEQAKEKIAQTVKKTAEKAGQATKATAEKAATAIAQKAAPFLGRFAACGFGKIIPVIGGIIPFWTILTVWTYLKS